MTLLLQTMALAFSSSDQEVINRQLQLEDEEHGVENVLEDICEITKCVSWIKENDYSKVALQFPDSMLKYSTQLSLALKKEVLADIFILGDTSYGSCCVDEVAAEHISADAIIHFGHACLSPVNRLPVLYIFGRYPIQIEDFLNKFQSQFEDVESYIVVICQASYFHAIDHLYERLKTTYKNVLFSQPVFPETTTVLTTNEEEESVNISKFGQKFFIPKQRLLSSYSMVYVGSEDHALMNLMLTFKTVFYSYNPNNNVFRQETLDVNKYLRKRYYYIEKAKDAKIVGILVGTLGVSNYLTIMNHLRLLAENVGKKTYTLVVGKLNIAKLANFPEIEVFVHVSCAETLFVDNSEFYQPIITPFEMEIACNQARTWTGDYITDFSELLPGAASHVPLANNENPVGDVSLLTGKMRMLTAEVEHTQESSSELAVRSNLTVANVAGECLINRSWKGLEPHLGETPVSTAVEGSKGIASEYVNEGT